MPVSGRVSGVFPRFLSSGVLPPQKDRRPRHQILTVDDVVGKQGIRPCDLIINQHQIKLRKGIFLIKRMVYTILVKNKVRITPSAIPKEQGSLLQKIWPFRKLYDLKIIHTLKE